jgi:hypothetical protein
MDLPMIDLPLMQPPPPDPSLTNLLVTRDPFVQTFEADALDPADFGHLAHLRVAFGLLAERPFLDACAVMRRGLIGLAERAGQARRYHETVTIAFMSLINERRIRGGFTAWEPFIAAHPELTERGFLARYYSTARLESALARSSFVLPEQSASGPEIPRGQ